MNTRLLISVEVNWNEVYNAVEVLRIQSSTSTREGYLDFLGLSYDIRNLFELEYTPDGHVLSGKDRITSLQDWLLQAKQLEGYNDTYHLAADRYKIGFRLNQEAPNVCWTGRKKWVVTFPRPDGSLEFQGFNTRLQAERFLQRLWVEGDCLYFIQCDDDAYLDSLLLATAQENWEGEATRKIEKMLLRKGYGSMRWKLASEDDEDRIFFDYYPLPEWYGEHYVVQAVLDCGTAGFCEDWVALIVRKNELVNTLCGLVDGAVEWFAGALHDMDYIREKADELRAEFSEGEG